MSLEEAINRLAQATENNAAVREIIRQRDEAVAQRDRWKRDADFYMARRDELYKTSEHLKRQVNGLRGAMKRIKRQRKALATR